MALQSASSWPHPGSSELINLVSLADQDLPSFGSFLLHFHPHLFFGFFRISSHCSPVHHFSPGFVRCMTNPAPFSLIPTTSIPPCLWSIFSKFTFQPVAYWWLHQSCIMMEEILCRLMALNLVDPQVSNYWMYSCLLYFLLPIESFLSFLTCSAFAQHKAFSSS